VPDWVLAVERAYVAAATGGAPPGDAPDDPRALAATGAVASHYLAVGTPRTFGVIADDARITQLSIDAHATWFAPREFRLTTAGAALADVLACDIVCVCLPIAIRAIDLRRGTHINVLAPATLDADLARVATVVHELPGLGALAAGLVDGRQLDELTVFVAGDAAIARAALSALL
jgi:hypothetical protein